jgi:hypothetical protein
MTRPRLQLHLSTLLIVSLLAAGLVWLNVRERQIESRDVPSSVKAFSTYRGFPYDFSCLTEHYSEYDDIPAAEKLKERLGEHGEISFTKDAAVVKTNFPLWQDTRKLLIDVAICLALLAVAAAAIEWTTRRMKRKPTP